MASPTRQRSKSPRRRSRSADAKRRSRSPADANSSGRPKKSSDGFRWKKKSNVDERDDRPGDRRDNRDDSYRPRRYREHDAGARDGDRGRRPREQDSRHAERQGDKSRPAERSEHKKPAPPSSSSSSSKPPAQPLTFIKVFVNDRLGTKAQIPCLPSDTVGDFKKLVAAYIGRAPHEIMIKRQGERPFKDIITLEDYGVSDGVQLDLELDTGE